MTSSVQRPSGEIPLVQVLAPAKINLTLEIVGRRVDGYHLLESMMQSVDIKDIVTVRVAPDEDGPVVADSFDAGPNGIPVPEGEGNLAARAVASLHRAASGADASVATGNPRQAFPGLHIHIEKRIPVAAGLGGGSADAAAALVAANVLWGLGWTTERLAEVGLQVGADVPFCLHGGTALARGVGERLQTVPDVETHRWAGVVLNPGFAVSTADVFRRYSEAVLADRPGDFSEDGSGRAQAMAAALQKGDSREAGRLLCNALEPVVERMHPEIGDLRRRALRAGAVGAVMCGSGPSVFALARDVEHAAVLAARLADAAPYVSICRFVSRGSRPMETERW